MDATSEKVPALRVSQLDASELDNEVVSLVKIQLNKVFKYYQGNFLVNYDPELTAFIKLLIWRFSVYTHEATLGQRILNLRYSSNTSTQWMSGRQKILYAAILIGGPWIKERLHTLMHFIGHDTSLEKIQKYLNWLDSGVKLAVILNFLAFLQKGVYQSLSERILGIQPMFPSKQGIREVGFEFMTRELLWHGFSEFLFFVLPLVNFQRIKNFATRYIIPRPKFSSPGRGHVIMECAVCGLSPVNPQEVGCQHVFCYYCVQSNYKSDPRFCCPLCGLDIPSSDSIKPLRIMLETG